jgi:ABC-type transporter Mla subunit MlaD
VATNRNEGVRVVFVLVVLIALAATLWLGWGSALKDTENTMRKPADRDAAA